LSNKKNNTETRIVLLILLAAIIIPLTLQSQDVKQEILDALSAGDTAKAITLLENDITYDPSYEYNYYYLGLIYKKQHKLDKALEQFEIALDKKKKFYEGLYALGKVQLELGMINKAEKSFKEGLKKAKDMEAEFHNGMGLVYLAKGDYNAADVELRQAIILDSTNAEFHTNLGNVNFANKVYPLAITEYERALQLDTASLDVYFNWAEACLELKDFTCALNKLNLVLQKDSTHAEAWMKAGGIYYRAARSSRSSEDARQMYQNTIGSYKKYIELIGGVADSTSGRAYYEAGMAYLILGGYPEALNYFSKVLSIPVEPKDIYYYYAWAYQGNQQYDSALVFYNKHIEYVEAQGEDFESGIKEVELYRRMGECYVNLKDHYNTIKYYKRSLEYDSTQDRVLYGTAVAYNYLQDYRNALIYYMKRIALGADERYWSIYYNAAMSALYLLEKGGLAAAPEEEDLDLEGDEEAMAEPANDPLAGVDLAELAVEYLEKITGEFWEQVTSNEKNMPTAIKAVSMLGSTYLYQLKDCENGKKNFERVLELEPDNCEAMKSLGYAYFGGLCPNNYTRALSYLSQTVECNTQKGKARCDDIDLLLWMGQAYHFRAVERTEAKQKEAAKEDYAKADDYYQEVLKCDPNNKDAQEGYRQVKWEH